MKLTRAKVTNYKSIEDSGCVNIENVTCLVGKNESGKTAFVQAIEKLNPAEVSKQKFDTMDYPRKNYSKYKDDHNTSPAIAVEAEFQLEDDELKEIEAGFGDGVLPTHQVNVTKGYDNKLCWDFEINEQPVVNHFLSKAGSPDEINKQAQKSENCLQLLEMLEGLPDAPPSVSTLITELSKYKTITVKQQIIDEYLTRYLPKFVYFDEYSSMEGRIAISNLKSKLENKQLEDSDRTFLSLLSLAGMTLNDLETEEGYERRTANLEAAAVRITDEVFNFWSQNKQLEVQFDLSSASPADPVPYNSGKIFHTRIKNNRHRASVSFSERSRGFVWFFSFLAYFSQLEAQDRNLVLLLDEPGLSLHAKAQNDFLKFIDERLAPKHQVIYTTHSPFMVDPKQLNRVRTVQDIDGKGTVVSDDVVRNDRDTVFPLQAALGYELTQTLFIGPNCLLVEGSSDIIYLQLLSEAVAAANKTELDVRWVIIPVGGADKISTFVSLLGANQLNIAVLIDVSSGDKQRIKNLQENQLLGKNSMIQIGQIVKSSNADIEDLFDPEFYIQLVNSAYAQELKNPIAMKDVEKGSPRIVKRIEAYFKENGIADGSFSHLRPALYLLKDQKLSDAFGEKTIERAAQLFEEINKRI